MTSFVVTVLLAITGTVVPDTDEFEETDFVPFVGLRRDVFDWNLIKIISQNETGNFVISPFSIKVILMLLAEMSGINSDTRQELLENLENITDVVVGRDIYREYLRELNKPDPENLVKCGSKVLVTDRLVTNQKIGAIFEHDYNAQMQKVNFNNVAQVTRDINSWVSELTQGNIANFLKQSDVVDSVVMLLNVVYFEGHWRKPFEKTRTQTGAFTAGTRGNVRSVQVEYMQDRGEYYYCYSKKLNAKFLRIPYAGKNYAMYILLPNDRNNIDDLIQNIDSKTLHAEAWYMDDYEVDVKLPKFKVNYPVSLKPYFQQVSFSISLPSKILNHSKLPLHLQLGINSIFSSNASLAGLARGQQVTANQLIVTAVEHKAGIAIDEEGTVAYAATEAQLVNKIGSGVKKFIVDRPFFFYIEQETTGNIVFAGKVTDPTKVGEQL